MRNKKTAKKMVAIICAVTVQAVTVNTEEMEKLVENTDVVLPNLTKRADEKIEMKYKYRENPFVLMAFELSIGTKMVSVGGMDAVKISEEKKEKSYNGYTYYYEEHIPKDGDYSLDKLSGEVKGQECIVIIEFISGGVTYQITSRDFYELEDKNLINNL